MFLQATVFFCSSVFLSSVAAKTENISVTYDEYVNKVIKFEEIKQKILKNFLDSEDGIATAFKMFDASTKIPNGVAAGNPFDLGNFDECYGIEYEQIYGKYCLGTLKLTVETNKFFEAFGMGNTQTQSTLHIHPEPRLLGLGEEYIGLHFAACIPSNMSAANISGLLEYTEDFCYSKANERKLSAGTIATIVILSIFLSIIVASTLFDIYLHYSKKEAPHELGIAFSFLFNGRKIFKSSNNSDQLLCLNGIKAISMMWVILGHEYDLLLNAPISNFLDIYTWEQNPANMLILGAPLSVDTFFVVGGLVTVYVFLKSVDKRINFNIFFYYIHRYLRLTPALAIMSLLHLYIFNYVSNGPLWKMVDTILVKPCEEGWWSTFLYITNYVRHGICVPQGWYLSVDMQLFILSPIILIPLKKWPKLILFVLGILSVAGCIVPFAIGYAKNLGNLLTADHDVFMNNYYTQTHTRFGPYVMGMILGYYVYKIKKAELRIRLSPLFVCAFWFVCLAGLTACVYAAHPLYISTEEDRWGNSLFLGFDRPAWALALCGIIFLCVCGFGGPIDKFLSLPIFQFLAKVSYSMYLVHYSIITMRYASMKNIMKFSNLGQMHIFWGDFMFTLFFSVILCLAFESPIITLEKYLFGRGSTTSRQNNGKLGV